MTRITLKDVAREDVEYNAITADECYDCHRLMEGCGRCGRRTCLHCVGYQPLQAGKAPRKLCGECKADDYASDLMMQDLREDVEAEPWGSQAADDAAARDD